MITPGVLSNGNGSLDETRDINAPWSHIAGKLKHVSVGGAGVWGIDDQDRIYHRSGCNWTLISGSLKQLDVGNNVVWGVAHNRYIYYRKGISANDIDGTDWIKIDGTLKHVSVSQKGHVWGVNAHDDIWHRTGASEYNMAGDSWFLITGKLKQISVGSGGVWGVDSANKIYYREGTCGDPDSDTSGSFWTMVGYSYSALKYVSSGDVIYGVNSNDWVYYRVGTSAQIPIGTTWQQISGSLIQIESLSHAVWGVDEYNDIYTKDTN